MDPIDIFLDAYQRLFGLWWQYVLTLRAIKKLDHTDGSGLNFQLIGFLEPQVGVSVSDAERQQFVDGLKTKEAISVGHLINLFAIYDDISTTLNFVEKRKQRIKEGKPTFDSPAVWKYTDSFEHFCSANSAAFFEAKATRNAWVHSSGKVDEDYEKDRGRFFPELDIEILRFNQMKDGETFDRLVNPYLSRVQVSSGDRLLVDRHYLYAVQTILFDRIALESGYHSVSLVDREPKLRAFSFDLVSPFF